MVSSGSTFILPAQSIQELQAKKDYIKQFVNSMAVHPKPKLSCEKQPPLIAVLGDVLVKLQSPLLPFICVAEAKQIFS